MSPHLFLVVEFPAKRATFIFHLLQWEEGGRILSVLDLQVRNNIAVLSLCLLLSFYSCLNFTSWDMGVEKRTERAKIWKAQRANSKCIRLCNKTKTLHVSLWILGYVQVMGICFWNRSFLSFCELKSLLLSTCQVSFERSNWKW